MRVRLLPADTGGPAFYRHEEPARVAASFGVQATIDRSNFTVHQAPKGEIVASATPADGGTRIDEWTQNVVVFQRPAKRSMHKIIEVLQRRGIAVVVDVDDDYSCLHPRNPVRDAHFNPALNPEVNWQHIAHACALADMVTVTTPALAERYGAHGRVAVLPNCMPAAALAMPSSSDGRTLGWSGRVANHPGDLDVTHGGIPEALRRAEWGFRVIGPPQDVGQRLGLEGEAQGTGALEMDEWHGALGQLDVGIVPLCRTTFNEAKSGLKGLEYAAHGIPFVASALPEYERLEGEGIGITAADRGRSWRAQLVAIMCDESLRCEMAQNAREAVARSHTYETEGYRWCEAWRQAIQNRRRSSR